MIPSWVLLPEATTADGHALNPTVFYRVQVGIQSPEGVSTLYEALRRFSDFLKLYVALKRTFPKKKLPVPPPKKSLMRIVPSKNHLQQRRHALVEWIVKLLADIDISRSAQVASFLNLEEAARSARADMEKWESHTPQTEISNLEPESRFAFKDTNSIEEGDMLEATSHMTQGREKATWHGRRHSADSISSEFSSTSGSEFSFAATGDGRETSEGLPIFDEEILKAVQALLPIDQRGNIRRVLGILHRRLTTAKADMEDMVARLNQETAVKDFLATKVRDLEVELQKMRQKSMESLQEAVSMEREGYTKLQWELEESRVALIRAEEQARLSQERLCVTETENERVKHELSEMKENFDILQVERDSIKAQAKSEMKLLVKEIRALRKSQPELKQELEVALRRNTALETEIQQQHKQKEKRLKILQEVDALRQRLQECTVDFLAKEDAKSSIDNAAVTDAADLLMTSDSRIGFLLAEAQLLAEEEDDDESNSRTQRDSEMPNGAHIGGSVSRVVGIDEPLRKILTEIYIDNAHLHKLVNSLTLKNLLIDTKQEKDQRTEAPARKSMLNRFLS